MCQFIDKILKIQNELGIGANNTITKDPELWNWVLNNCDPKLPINSLNSAKIYSACHPEISVECPYGKLLIFRDIKSGFAKCGKPSTCQCAKDFYQTDSWKATARVAASNRKQTNIKIYNGTTPMASPAVRERLKKTNMERRGVGNPGQCPLVRDKMRKSTAENHNGMYNPSHFQLSPETFEILNNKDKFSEILENNSLDDIKKTLDICETTIRNYHKKHDLDILKSESSQFEHEIGLFLKTMNTNYSKDRTVCKPQEIDFLIREYNLAIEYNGLYTHSEKSSKFKCNRSYHMNKSKKCKDQGIHLIHIFGDEWANKKDICKSIIKGYLNKQEQIIPARKCVIEIVPNKILRTFLNENHLQGWCNASKAFVLKFNDEIIAAMTFGKPRYNKTVEWELTRLAFKINTTIIGGTEKLFKFALSQLAPASIVSYCDMRWFTGKVYGKLGFTEQSTPKSTYWYTDYSLRYHRSKYQKHKLVKMGYDESLTEKQITSDIMGLDRIWDCGQTTWIWNK